MLITQKHLSKGFDNDLHDVIELFMQMGYMAAEQVMVATRALIAADEATAKKVIADDQLINQLDIKIDEQIILLVTKRQPAANDLRLVMAVSKGIVDFERVGDEAEKIARMACKLIKDGASPRGYSEVQHLSNKVHVMLLDAIDAFSHMNPQQAFSVLQSDVAVNEEYQSATRALMTYIMEDSRHVSRVMNILWVLRALERVGDHAKNIAELVIFCTSGKDVRHTNFMQVEKIVQQTTDAGSNK